MNTGDFLLYTLDGESMPISYAAEIISVDAGAKSFTCYSSQSNQRLSIQLPASSGGQWTGTDDSSNPITLASHQILSPGGVDPTAGSSAIITFSDGTRVLCLVNNAESSVDVTIYCTDSPTLTIDNNVVTASTWDAYPVDTQITSIEGCTTGSDTISGAINKSYVGMTPDWLDTATSQSSKDEWLKTNTASKTFFADEPSNNIDRLPIPPWFDSDKFYTSFTTAYGADATTIIGTRSNPVIASYFVVHDTTGGKEPDTSTIDSDADDRGVNLFLGTAKEVYRPHIVSGVDNDWDTVGWGTVIGNIRANQFVHTELSPYNLYEKGGDAMYFLKTAFTDLLKISIDGVINENSNFTLRQYELLACAYLTCSIRKGSFLTVTMHREVDFSFCRNAHGDPVYFDLDYFYQLIATFVGLNGVTFGLQTDRAYAHNQVNLDGYINDFLPYVQNKNTNPDAANQYGTRKVHSIDGHVYSNDCRTLSGT